MWKNDIYFIPIVALLTTYKLREDVHLEGDLSEEFTKLMNEYLSFCSLKIVMDPSVKYHVCRDYSKDTSIGIILIDIVRLFQLDPKIDAMSDNIIKITFRVKEDSNGCSDSES